MTAATWSAIKLGPDKKPARGTTIATGPTEESVAHLWRPGDVIIAWTAPHKPVKRWSQATTAKVRKQRLMKRLQRKFPLFAAQLYEAEIAARPDYYAAQDRA